MADRLGQESRSEGGALSFVRRQRMASAGIAAALLLITLGVFARNGWLPHTDELTGEKRGWFGNKLPKNAGSTWNPLSAPLPTPTPQLSKEYIYAGSRLLAVEDANASASPPADLAVWRPSSGYWYVMGPDGSVQASASWGTSGDITVQGDYDGDGKTDFSVFRPSTNYWYLMYSSTGSTDGFAFGTSGDIPAVADFDGDGRTDVAVFRPSNGTWYIKRSSDGQTSYQQFGQSGDVPAPADHDGDGRADISIWRPGSTGAFYTLRSSDGTLQTASYGTTGDKPIPSDYDGDGRADYAVFRPGASAYFYILRSSDNQTIGHQFGTTVDVPVPNDYDGDARTDIAVFRSADSSQGAGDNGNWYILQSASGNSFRADHWGTTGDIPVPAYYRR